MRIWKKKSVTWPDTAPFRVVPFTMLDSQQVTLATGYSEIYEQSAPVHAIVNLIARSLNQIGLKAYMHSLDGPLELDRSNRLSVLLRQPPNFKFALGRDLCVHGESLWLMLGENQPTELVRLAPEDVEVLGRGSLAAGYKLGSGAPFPPEDVLHVKVDSLVDPLRGISPLKPLRPLLAEDLAANAYRLASWSGKAGSFVTRPLEAPEWSDVARERFIESMKAKGPGDLAVLDEGMGIADAAPPSAQDTDFLAGRRFVFEAIASVFGVPAAVLAGSSSDRNMGEARRNLIQDALSPLASMIEDALTSQLVPRLFGGQAAHGRIFCEFSIESKLRGSFREQAQVFQMATGGAPWLQPAEVRAMLNLPPIEEAGPRTPIKLRLEP